MADVFKVWIQAERCNDERGEYENIGEPEPLAAFRTEDAALGFVRDLHTCFESARIHEREGARIAPAIDGAPLGADCTCYTDCRMDSHSGERHQHESEPCPVHPDAEMVG